MAQLKLGPTIYAIGPPVIDAYNSLRRLDVIAVSESMLDSSVSYDDIFIEGFSIIQATPSLAESVCTFRESLPIRRRSDLELLQEVVVSEVTIARKEIFLVAVYRSPSQKSE